MLRQVGALAVFSSLSWCGMRRALWYRQRLDCLEQWQQALLEGERMLCDLGETTPAYLTWLTTLPRLAPVAKCALEELEGEAPFAESWAAALEKGRLPLGEEERRALEALGGVLGRCDPAQQRLALETARERLARCRLRAEEERLRLGRMWSVLGVCAGALAVVLLY